MKRCLVCRTPIHPFFSLGRMPLVNAFLKKSAISKEKKYELTLGFCPSCYLVQLTKTIDPKKLFTNYIYVSATSSAFIRHAQETAFYLKKRFSLTRKSLVIELASNDGTQLKHFQDSGIRVLGIDPAKNIARLANKAGIPTIPSFFNYALAKKIRRTQRVQADIIYGANVLAHVPPIVDFLKGVKEILSINGTAIFESPYIGGLFENKFDTIYHEHVFYYSGLSLVTLFCTSGLEIYDIEMTAMQGGSFRLYASHPGVFPKTQRLIALLKKERSLGYDRIQTYKKIKKNVEKLRRSLRSLLKQIKSKGQTIAAYGAPAKGVILLNYFGITDSLIDFIVDKSPRKQGLLIPGVHLCVYHPDKILDQKPDYILILAWNIADEIISSQMKYHTYPKRFIIPIPKIKVLSHYGKTHTN